MIRIKDKSFILSITDETIQEKVKTVAQNISHDFCGEQPVMICILNGAFMFAADLVRYLTIQPDIIFAKFASYEGTDTTGNVKELIGVNANLKGRKVIIVEDIVDTGTTLKHIQKELQGRGAIEVKTASLLVKPGKLKEDVKVDYCAMEIPDDFIVGYGMDYDGLGRNLKDIYTVEENQ